MFKKRKVGSLESIKLDLPSTKSKAKLLHRLNNRLKLKKSKFYNFFIGFLIVISLLFTVKVIFSSFDFSIYRLWEDLVDKMADLEKDENWFVNILLIWAWGWNHDWAELTDTLIVASVDLENQNVVMLSVPRDLYLRYNVNYRWSRINEIYRDSLTRLKILWINDENAKNEARWILIKEVSKLLDIDITYFAQIDFRWFEKMIDTFWWVDIYVKNTIIDDAYPDNNWWYETFKIEEWQHKLDWVTALKYARSRHSSSDFDRAWRQQLIISAVKQKVLEYNLTEDMGLIKKVFSVISKYCETNLSISDILSLGYKLKDFPKENIYHAVLNDDYEKKWWFLWTPPRVDYGWAFVLIPFNWEGNFSKIKVFSDIIFNHRELSNLSIEVLNSTKRSWIASKVWTRLMRYWLNIGSMWNHPKSKDVTEIIFYTSKVDVGLIVDYWKKIFPLTPVKIVDSVWYYEETDVDVEIIVWNNIRF